MAIDYTIAAIPTFYGGRQYRSRLEAKWAAFFDVLRIQFEYEPADLGRWSPDFLIPSRPHPILVEVKPLSRFDEDIAAKMKFSAIEGRFVGDLLLLGTSPLPSAQSRGSIVLGWWSSTRTESSFSEPWTEAMSFMVGPNRSICGGRPDDSIERIVSLDGVMVAAWDAACNLVQWRPK